MCFSFDSVFVSSLFPPLQSNFLPEDLLRWPGKPLKHEIKVNKSQSFPELFDPHRSAWKKKKKKGSSEHLWVRNSELMTCSRAHWQWVLKNSSLDWYSNVISGFKLFHTCELHSNLQDAHTDTHSHEFLLLFNITQKLTKPLFYSTEHLKQHRTFKMTKGT